MSIFDKGVEFVMGVVEENVEWFFGDWPEGEGIGSSDVGAVVRSVFRDCGVEFNTADDVEVSLIRNAVNNVMSDVLAAR